MDLKNKEFKRQFRVIKSNKQIGNILIWNTNGRRYFNTIEEAEVAIRKDMRTLKDNIIDIRKWYWCRN